MTLLVTFLGTAYLANSTPLLNALPHAHLVKPVTQATQGLLYNQLYPDDVAVYFLGHHALNRLDR